MRQIALVIESEGARDKPLAWGAPYQRQNLKPDFINDNDAWRSRSAREQVHAEDPDALTPNPIEAIFKGTNQSGVAKPHLNGTAALKALFKSVKEILLPSDEDARPPSRRRRGDTDKGFIAACRSVLGRVAKAEATTVSCNVTFVDMCAEAGVFLSDPLDPLNPWQEGTDNDHWHEDEFSATYWDNFPQP